MTKKNSMVTNETSVEIHRCHTYVIADSTAAAFSLVLILTPTFIKLQKDTYILPMHVNFYRTISLMFLLESDFRQITNMYKSRYTTTSKSIIMFLPCSKS
jgi:hypothetical protein